MKAYASLRLGALAILAGLTVAMAPGVALAQAADLDAQALGAQANDTAGLAKATGQPYTPRSADLLRTRAALAKVKSGVGNAYFAIQGDSNTRGTGSTTDATQGYNGWCQRLAVNFTAVGYPATCDNFFGSGGYSGSFASNDDRIVVSRSGISPNPGLKSVGGSLFGLTQSGDTLAFSNKTPAQTCDVFWFGNSGNGTFSWSVDGGAATNISTNQVTTGFYKSTIALGAKTTHTTTLTWVSGTAYVLGMDCYDNTVSSIHIWNWGWHGSNSSDLLGANAWHAQVAIPAFFKPDLIIGPALGTNDLNTTNNFTPATVLANLSTLITAYKTQSDVVMLAVGPAAAANSGSTANQQALNAGLYRLAQQLSVPLLDEFTWMGGDETVAEARGLYRSDHLHKNAAGHQLTADQVVRYIAGTNATPGISKADVQLRDRAQTFLTAAQRGIGNITDVMSSSPTFSRGTTNANSDIVAASTTSYNGGRFQAHDTVRVEPVGSTFNNDTTNGRYLPNGIINNTSTLARGGAKGAGLRFALDADAFDIAIDTNGSAITLYVTDIGTGVRQRATANDYTTTTGYAYYKWVFADARPRIVEVYCDGFSKFRGINVAPAYSIWRAPTPNEPRFAVLWDSWGGGGSADATNTLKLKIADYMGERLGIANVINLSVGSTGFLAANGTAGTFRDRMTIGGDLDASRVGNLAGLLMPCSINDAGSSDGQVQTEAQLTYALAMVKQPEAIIFGAGPSTRKSTITAQSRYDACKAGFLAAAGASARMIWLDNSPSGEAWWFGPTATGNVSIYIGSDDFHANTAGMAFYGRRIGASIANALSQAVAGF